MCNLTPGDGQSGVVALRPSSIQRDIRDSAMVFEFFTEKFMFFDHVILPSLVNIATGLVAPANVNVSKSEELGEEIINEMTGKNPMDLTIKKVSLAVQILTKSVFKTKSMPVADPQRFFQRALSLQQDNRQITLEECLSFELSSLATSLFDPQGFMRFGTKADLSQHLIKN